MRRSRRAIAAIVAAGGVGILSSHASAGPTLTTFYTTGEIATNSSFTTGVQSVSISNTSPTVFVPLGDYFEFGISTVLTGNVNATAGDAWDLANQARGNPAQPSLLGMAILNYTVASTDSNASHLAPQHTASSIGTIGGQTEWTATTVFSNTTPLIRNPGDVETNSGTVGANETIEEGDFAAPNPDTAAGVARLALFSGTSATPAGATQYFTNLQYQAVGSGLVGLLAGIGNNGNGTDFYVPNNPGTVNPNGTVDTDASYSLAQISVSGTLVNPQVLAVYIEPSLIWDGKNDHTSWNTSAPNWNNNGTLNATYSNPDFVTFDDSAPTNSTTISVSGSVSPLLVTVNSSANNYIIMGAGSIAGSATFVKQGTSTLTLSTANTYSGPTNVTGGTLIVNKTGALPTNNALSISGGAKVQLATSTGLATLSSLTITGNGVFDIGNNHVIINYGASDPKTTILQYLQSGAANGAWNGSGITSSAIAGNPTYGVGFGDGADGVDPGLSSGQIELKYTLLGDVDLNGIVNGVDFGIVAANFNKGVSNGWESGDFDYNGIVNGIDFGELATNFNKGDSGTATLEALDEFAAANGLLADVPEPGTIGVLGIAAVGLMGRRRKVLKID